MATQEPEARPAAPTKVCPNCGVQSQTSADKCPSCGKKYKQKKGGCLKWLGIITLGLIAIIVISVLASSGGDDKAKNSAGGSGTTTQAADESTTTAPAPAEPAAPDASPYVVGFGDLSALSFPAGKPGELAIVSTGAQDELNDSVTIIVRNNTSDPIGQIEATGTAHDAAGALVGSGSSQGFEPVVVAPGEIAYGYVYFEGGFPKASTLAFDVTGEEVGTYFRPITITEINNTGDAVIGGLSNNTGVDVTGPISVHVLCFAADGTTIGPKDGYAEQSDLADGATGSSSISLYGTKCPIGLAAASGYGSL